MVSQRTQAFSSLLCTAIRQTAVCRGLFACSELGARYYMSFEMYVGVFIFNHFSADSDSIRLHHRGRSRLFKRCSCSHLYPFPLMTIFGLLDRNTF